MTFEKPNKDTPAILAGKEYGAASLFEPASLLREARRQKRLSDQPVPAVCILDPDGDIGRFLKATGRARIFRNWPCYHTELLTFELGSQTAGIVCCAVGAPFAVLIAEELFASGCKLLLSVTSAGQLVPSGPPPYFIIIDRSLRDEGTSYHYAQASTFAYADKQLLEAAEEAAIQSSLKVVTGGSWTTDAPFRETDGAIMAARAMGLLAVEMEAAALYTFASTKQVPVLCLAHVTNTMGQAEQDFEKGEADGAAEALRLLGAISDRLSPR